MGDMLHRTTIAAPTTAVYAVLTEQYHPKSSLHFVFTS
jgi:hypothetical protein